MLPNFSVVSTNIKTVCTGVSSCLVVRTLRTSSCGRLTAPHLKQYWNYPFVETVFVCLLLCYQCRAQWLSNGRTVQHCRLKKAANCADVSSRWALRLTGEWIWYDVSAENTFSCCFYGCETWSLTLREERRLRVFENRVLRGIIGPKRDEVRGEWRKLHS